MNRQNKAAHLRSKRIHQLMLGILCAFLVMLPWLSYRLHPTLYIRSDSEVLEISSYTLDQGEVAENIHTLVRGTPVILQKRLAETSEVQYGSLTMRIPNENLVDTPAKVVQTAAVYPRRRIELRSSKTANPDGPSIAKGQKLDVLQVLPADLNLSTGEISWYKVEADGKSWWVNGECMEWTQENALKTYSSNLQINTVLDEQMWEGYSRSQYEEAVDLKGWTQPQFEDNLRPAGLQGVHITLENLLANKSDILTLAAQGGLNALVIALKGPYGQIWYDSDIPFRYFQSPDEALKSSLASKSDLASLFRELKDRGIYIIARLETFQDSLLAQDNPDYAITNADGSLVSSGSGWWLSPYQRRNWQYNVDMACELARLGANEIQFDFCRFPEGLELDEDQSGVDLKNEYQEGRVEAISNFLYFAREQLEPLHVYTAVDMYAGPILDQYDYALGHFAPALMASANIVCPMAYLDSLASTSLAGQGDVYSNAKQVMASFAQAAKEQETQIPNPALLCLWLQGWGYEDASLAQKQLDGLKQEQLTSALFWTDQGDMDVLTMLHPVLRQE